ncbi:hypothetical protein [Catenulispora rubra]|uniref:hypothetical protein n=1 Tax=Catenulispora rubra TaxID=280293 RepID=UPI0018926BA3|nr:hypothetical protein [Catenulispora rubra]
MSKNPHSAARRVLGLAALSGLGLAAAPAAHAATQNDDITGAEAGTHQATAALGATPLYPLAHTPLDLLSNNFRVPVSGMDLSTFPLTAPFKDGLPLREVPVVGTVLP